TQQGGFADWGAPPTGRPAEWSLIVIWRVACGKLAENWVEADRLTELRQLGIITDDELTTVGAPSVATPAATPAP
ncbi:MAG TPA: ester cyclase, partial [Thermomicrobiales bacterium]|nr:ester cyclase [Thermomicrobiales bacterium]